MLNKKCTECKLTSDLKLSSGDVSTASARTLGSCISLLAAGFHHHEQVSSSPALGSPRVALLPRAAANRQSHKAYRSLKTCAASKQEHGGQSQVSC